MKQSRMFETEDLPLFSGTAPRADVDEYREEERGPEQLRMPGESWVEARIYDDDSTEEYIWDHGQNHLMQLKHSTGIVISCGRNPSRCYEHVTPASLTRLHRLIAAHI